MVTAAKVTKLSREELEKLPTKTPEGRDIVYISPSWEKGGEPFVVSVKTYEAQSRDISKYQDDPNIVVRSLPPTPSTAETLSRREEKRDIREMAQKRGEAPPKTGSQTWEDYIAQYGTRAKVPSKHIARRYEKEFEEVAMREAEKEAEEKAKFPTREERIRETERKQRILATIRKQEAARIRDVNVLKSKEMGFFPRAKRREIPPEELRAIQLTPEEMELKRGFSEIRKELARLQAELKPGEVLNVTDIGKINQEVARLQAELEKAPIEELGFEEINKEVARLQAELEKAKTTEEVDLSKIRELLGEAELEKAITKCYHIQKTRTV